MTDRTPSPCPSEALTAKQLDSIDEQDTVSPRALRAVDRAFSVRMTDATSWANTAPWQRTEPLEAVESVTSTASGWLPDDLKHSNRVPKGGGVQEVDDAGSTVWPDPRLSGGAKKVIELSVELHLRVVRTTASADTRDRSQIIPPSITTQGVLT